MLTVIPEWRVTVEREEADRSSRVTFSFTVAAMTAVEAIRPLDFGPVVVRVLVERPAAEQAQQIAAQNVWNETAACGDEMTDEDGRLRECVRTVRHTGPHHDRGPESKAWTDTYSRRTVFRRSEAIGQTCRHDQIELQAGCFGRWKCRCGETWQQQDLALVRQIVTP